MFLRPLLLLTALTSSLFAAALDARYEISYAFFPSMGTVELHYRSAGGRYTIEANATLHGLAAMLAHHHAEYHVSSGRIDAQGRLIPDRYDTLRTLDGYRREQRFAFSPARQRVTRHERTERTVTSKHFDMATMRYVSEEHTDADVNNRLMPYRASDDLLSLYFNARERLGALREGSVLRFRAAGAGNGVVTLKRDAEPQHFTLFIHQDIFRSSRGEMQIELDKALFVKKAVLKDVFLFGDLKVTREALKEEP